MTNQDYEQKKRECLLDFCKEHGFVETADVKGIFGYAFDRVYALGKQTETISQEEIEKAWQDYAKEIGLPESLNYATRSMIEIAIKQAFKAGVKLNGKQEKDAEETPISERLCEEEKSQLEWLYNYLNRAADMQEDESVSVAILFEVMERLEDMFGIDLLTHGHGKSTPNDAEDTVIQGWVARDKGRFLGLYPWQPKRGDMAWLCGSCLALPINTFPDLTWDDDPIEVELTIKRKKK